MVKENKINWFGGSVEKPVIIQKQAAKCIQGRTRLSSLQEDLPRQLFEDAPTLYLNPTEKMIISDLVSGSEPVATVLGSGDFAIDASMHGARDILTFDINSNQYYVAALKLKALQNLSYEDFWNFFSNLESKDWLSSVIYEKLKSCAEKDLGLYAFFDELMTQRIKEDKRRERIISDLRLFNMRLPDVCDVMLDEYLSRMLPNYEISSVFRTISGMGGEKQVGTYLKDEQSYHCAKTAIAETNISFVKADLIRLKSVLERLKKFDLADARFQSIYLSNVPEFINGEIFAKTVSEQLMSLLNVGGRIAYCCQGTSIDFLNMNDNLLNNLKNQLSVASPVYKNLSAQQLLNVVEGLRLIKENFDVEFSEVPTLCNDNGICDKDTYVYIKKR